MKSTSTSDLEARLDALANRLEASLTRARAGSPVSKQHGVLTGELHAAEARAQLQAQRCAALEDRVAELEAALADAGAAAHRELDGAQLDGKLGEALQTKLLEVERLSSELADLRRSNDEWRTRARSNRRELDAVSLALEQATAQLSELRIRDESASKRLAELERLVAEQRRELELAERRAKHLRSHMNGR